MFDDKGEVKRLVESLIQRKDPDVAIERMRKMDFSYIFSLSKRGRVESSISFETKSMTVGTGEMGT